MNMIKIVILLSLFGVPGVSVANNYSNYLRRSIGNCQGGNTSRNGQAGVRASRTGSGEWHGQGNWSSYSEYGGSVGGTEDGCYYTANWSNC